MYNLLFKYITDLPQRLCLPVLSNMAATCTYRSNVSTMGCVRLLRHYQRPPDIYFLCFHVTFFI